MTNVALFLRTCLQIGLAMLASLSCFSKAMGGEAMQAVAPAQPKPADPGPTNKTVGPGRLMRFSLSGGFHSSSLELRNAVTTPEIPNPEAYSGDPLQGTFKALGLTTVRTLEGFYFELGNQRALVFSLGLDLMSSGDSLGTFKKDKGAEFQLSLWSIAAELGLNKQLTENQDVEIVLGGCYSLGGKARFQYKSRSETGVVKNSIFEESIESGMRFSLAGAYTFRVISFLRAGIAFEGYYGTLKLKDRSESAVLMGSAAYLTAQFVID